MRHSRAAGFLETNPDVHYSITTDSQEVWELLELSTPSFPFLWAWSLGTYNSGLVIGGKNEHMRTFHMGPVTWPLHGGAHSWNPTSLIWQVCMVTCSMCDHASTPSCCHSQCPVSYMPSQYVAHTHDSKCVCIINIDSVKHKWRC